MIKNDSILYLTVTEQRSHKIAKILGPGSADAANPQNDFSLALSHLFREVIPYDYLKSYFEKGVRVTNREIYELARRKNPQYVLWRAREYQVLESTLQAIRELGSIVIAWFWDDHFRFEDYTRLYISSLDYSVTNDPNAIKKYKSLGAKCLYCPGVCAGEYYKKLDLPKKYDVSFVGHNAWKRDVFIEKIRNLGIEVATFGDGWDSGHIPFDQMLNIFNSSKINLNFSRVGHNGVKQIKGRIFEIAMCGGCVLTEYVPGLERFFILDKEIVCFKSVEEAVDKIKYYLRHDKEREAIARAGRNRTSREYTWDKVLPSIFTEIEKDIKTNGRPNVSPDNNVEVPEQASLAAFSFHYNWAKAWLAIGCVELSKDQLALSLTYDPSNLKARCLSIIAHFPSVMRSDFLHIYIVLWEKILKCIKVLRSELRANPLRRRMKQGG